MTSDSEEDDKKHKFSEKGKRMAAVIAEYIMMRYFFPEIRDRRILTKKKQMYVADMQFSMQTGQVEKATKKFKNRHNVDDVYRLFSSGQEQPIQTQEQAKQMLKLLGDMKFIRSLSDFSEADKVGLLNCFELYTFQPGQRIFGKGFNLDSFNLILKGKVGILGPDTETIKQAKKEPDRLVCCTEA